MSKYVPNKDSNFELMALKSMNYEGFPARAVAKIFIILDFSESPFGNPESNSHGFASCSTMEDGGVLEIERGQPQIIQPAKTPKLAAKTSNTQNSINKKIQPPTICLYPINSQ